MMVPKPDERQGKEIDKWLDAKIRDHERRLNRLEEEMDTARQLIAQEIKNRINGIGERPIE